MASSLLHFCDFKSMSALETQNPELHQDEPRPHFSTQKPHSKNEKLFRSLRNYRFSSQLHIKIKDPSQNRDFVSYAMVSIILIRKYTI